MRFWKKKGDHIENDGARIYFDYIIVQSGMYILKRNGVTTCTMDLATNEVVE